MTSTALKRLAIVGLLLAAAEIAAAGSAGVRGVAPELEKTPTMDGRIGPREWKAALRVTGVRTQQRKPKYQFLEERMATVFLGFTGKRLHLAVVSELPPDQRLTSQKRGRDSNKMVFDSSVEMWLAAYRAGTRGKKLGEDHFQFVVNSNGNILDTAFRGGNPDPGWDADWQIANGVRKKVSEGPAWMRENGVWVCEISVPFEDLGIEKPAGRTLGLLVARNWHRNWDQSTWLTYGGASFSTRSAYPKIRLAADAPAV